MRKIAEPKITEVVIPPHHQWLLTTYDDKEYVLDETEYRVVQEAIKRDVKFVNFGTITLAMSDIRRIEQEQVPERRTYDFEG